MYLQGQLNASGVGELMVGGCFGGPRRTPVEFVDMVGKVFGDVVGLFCLEGIAPDRERQGCD